MIDGALAICGMGVCLVLGLLLGSIAELYRWERRIKKWKSGRPADD
jgi:hypothetical protein